MTLTFVTRMPTCQVCVCAGGSPAAGRQGRGDRGGAGEGEEEEQDGDGDPQVGTDNQIFLSSVQNIFCSRANLAQFILV